MRGIKTPDSNKILPVDGRDMKVTLSKWENLIGFVQGSSKRDGTRKISIIGAIVV